MNPPKLEQKFFKVKVMASSKKQSVRILSPDSFLVQVKSPAVKNQANSECLEVLARFLNCDRKTLRILRGAHFSTKLIEWIKER